MKYPGLILKLAAVGAIAVVLGHYQKTATARAELVAENEAKIAEVEAYNRGIQMENEKRKAAAKGGAEAETSYRYKDGTFEGTAQGYGGPITVAVTIERDVLTDVQVLSHDGEDPAYYMLAEPLADAVLSAQGTDVDAASGATFSSRGILDAVDAALAGAEQ